MLIFIRYCLALFVLTLLLTGVCYGWVSWRAKAHIFTDMNQLTKKQIAIVLGTSKYLSNGNNNEFYRHRIEAAAKLYQVGKVDYFVVSGDNRKVNYNEPKVMKQDLIAAGIPAQRIQPDYAGFRTLDSILRMHHIFGHRDYLIISQRFHNQRALFLAHAHGQTPIAFNAIDPQTQGMTKVLMRELLARVKAIWDIITNKQAKFYGTQIEFPEKIP